MRSPPEIEVPILPAAQPRPTFWPTREILAGVFGSRWKEAVLGAFRAYFDASSSSPEQGVLAVAGYWAHGEAWDMWFDGPWRNLLADARLDYFHMTDFESRLKEYANWSNEKRTAFLQEAIRLINRAVGGAIGVAIDLEAFAARRQEWKLCGVRHPYHLCAWRAGCLLVRQIRDNHQDPDFALFFEAGDQGTGDLKAALDAMATRMPKVFPESYGLTFLSKQTALPLQAADYLAYETHKQALRKFERDHRAQRKSLTASLDTQVPYFGEVLDGPWLDGLLQEVFTRSAPRPPSA